MIVGPWTGELGWELLRWIPYIRDRDPTIAISRGGNDDWYPCKVLNLFDVVSPDEFRELFLKRGLENNTLKQYRVDELDRLVLERFGLEPDIHPSEMWNAADQLIPRFERLPRPERLPGLPAEYVAARLYRNDWLRRAPKISENLPVVALKTIGQVDTHTELKYEADIIVECDLKTAIATQNRVVAHAKKLICPYGGMVYVGLLHGISVEAHSRAYGLAHSWQTRLEKRLVRKFGGSLTRKIQ